MKTDKVILVVLVLAITGWRVSRYFDKINPPSDPMIIDVALDASKNKTIVLSSDKKNIFHLDLIVTGNMDGIGKLTISSTDSTVYKSYDVKPGAVKFDYHGDWYNSKCLVTYHSTTRSSGQLKIKNEFVGD